MIGKVLKENLIYLILLVLLIISFIVIYNTSLFNYVINIDGNIIFYFNNIIRTKLTCFFANITHFGDIYIPIIIISCVYLLKSNKLYSILLSCSYLLSGIIAFIIKNIIARPRPLYALIEIPKSYSFPSGHTLTSIVFYFTLWYLLTLKSNKITKIISFILISLLVISIGVSRIYLKVHYFSDVIGGVLSGILLLIMIINIIKKNFKEKL